MNEYLKIWLAKDLYEIIIGFIALGICIVVSTVFFTIQKRITNKQEKESDKFWSQKGHKKNCDGNCKQCCPVLMGKIDKTEKNCRNCHYYQKAIGEKEK